MKRLEIPKRHDWQKKVEEQGLIFHTEGTHTYWNESAAYEFSLEQIEEIEKAAVALHTMCLAAVGVAINRGLLPKLGIPATAIPMIEDSWKKQEPSLYGRFDLAYDGIHPPKLLEYNADTPTSLLEAAVIQWRWFEDTKHGSDQWNIIHERLVERWKEFKNRGLVDNTMHFGYMDTWEDYLTTTYLRETAQFAGIEGKEIKMEEVGWHNERKCFVDQEHQTITHMFKLFPWEWMHTGEFADELHRTKSNERWFEPAWKLVLSSKGILALLWELFPDNQYLLPAWFNKPQTPTYVRKPLLSREGANVQIIENGKVAEAGPDQGYGSEGCVYQELYELPCHQGHYPILGAWIVGNLPAGMGIRESNKRVTGNLASFVPHVIK